MLNIFNKQEETTKNTGPKFSKMVARPSEEEVNNFNPLAKSLPSHIRKIDNQLILDIMDRLHGPDGLHYEKVLNELNSKFEPRKGKSGNEFYDEAFMKSQHPTGIIIGKISNN